MLTVKRLRGAESANNKERVMKNLLYAILLYAVLLYALLLYALLLYAIHLTQHDILNVNTTKQLGVRQTDVGVCDPYKKCDDVT